MNHKRIQKRHLSLAWTLSKMTYHSIAKPISLATSCQNKKHRQTILQASAINKTARAIQMHLRELPIRNIYLQHNRSRSIFQDFLNNSSSLNQVKLSNLIRARTLRRYLTSSQLMNRCCRCFRDRLRPRMASHRILFKRNKGSSSFLKAKF